VIEIAVLFAGVVSRYVFRSPLVWSDELASILFLWLSMLGSVIALRHGEHMRMTAFVGGLAPPRRALLDAFALAASLAFLALIMYPVVHYAAEEAMIVTPALEISNVWRASALPVGFGLMLVVALLRLLRVCTLRDAAFAVGGVTAVVVAFALAGPLLAPLGKLNLVIFFVVLVAVNVFSGVPIAFSFALATFGYLALTTQTPMLVMVGRLDEGMSHLILLAVPLFIFLGALIEMTGMARAMIQFLASLLGHVRGGLSYVLIGAMYLVSGISGSKVADMAAIAPVLFPEMKRRGAAPGDLVALLAATGAQTETIPPSIVLITIGSVTGVSIAALFNGGMVPAVVLGVMLCAVVWWRYRKEDLSQVRRYDRKEIARFLLVALPALLLPFVIRAAVVEGVATATEVSTIGVVYSVLVGLFVYRQFPWKRVMPMLVETPPRFPGPSSSSLGAPPQWRGASPSPGSRKTLRP
jgi:TRAP-type C4-dicarboxylate transport system permease small subunit